MILRTQKTRVEIPEGIKPISYSVNSNVMQFIAREKMLSNPVQTMVQEVMCNARDAHRELGKWTAPITVSVPTGEDPTLVISDSGPGMSPARKAIFTTYGESTKREDDTQTGGFGLGAKAILAMSDSFTVDTVWEDNEGPNPTGKRYRSVWYHFINEDGGSGYFELERNETEEPTGTAFHVPIAEDRVDECVEAVKRMYQWWSIKPTILNASFPELKFSNKGYGIKLISDGPGFVVVDGVPYPYPSNPSIENGFCVFFKSGEIAVTATREAIDKTAANDEAIKARLEERLRKMRNVDLSVLSVLATRANINFLRLKRSGPGYTTDSIWSGKPRYTRYYYDDVPVDLEIQQKKKRRRLVLLLLSLRRQGISVIGLSPNRREYGVALPLLSNNLPELPKRGKPKTKKVTEDGIYLWHSFSHKKRTDSSSLHKLTDTPPKGMIGVWRRKDGLFSLVKEGKAKVWKEVKNLHNSHSLAFVSSDKDLVETCPTLTDVFDKREQRKKSEEKTTFEALKWNRREAHRYFKSTYSCLSFPSYHTGFHPVLKKRTINAIRKDVLAHYRKLVKSIINPAKSNRRKK